MAQQAQGGYRIAIVGATGVVGRAMISKLRTSHLPISELVPFASDRSAGVNVEGAGTVHTLSPDSIAGFDLALFSAGSAVSADWAPQFVDQGAIVIDNSSCWRRHEHVPLVVSEVNSQALSNHQGIIANPNCQTMQMVVVLHPIHEAASIERVIVSTYQSASGTGQAAVAELTKHSQRMFSNDSVPPSQVYPHQLAGNILPVCGDFASGDDYTDEERKMIDETRKILGDDSFSINPFCARVPVPNCHSESLNVQTAEPLSVEQCRDLLANAPGITVIDNPEKHQYPMALDVAGKDGVFVGRIRKDPTHPRALNFWVVADNLLKGAASNAVDIASLLHDRSLVRIQGQPSSAPA